MARTITIKKGGGGIYSPGWHELTISKAKYSEYQGTQCIDIWFKDYPDNFNARVYAKNGKNGEEFAIGQVYRFANAGITGSLEGPDKTMMIKIDDSAEALEGCKLNGYFYKDGEYSRCLKQDYVKKNTGRDNNGAFVSTTESTSTATTDAADIPF